MENIPSSFMGYKKEAVENIINQKDTLLNAQQKDIDYLRKEITRLEKDLKKSKKKEC